MYWFLLLCFIPDGELVLRNGKVLRYQGEYQQEGQWVRFTDHEGKYLQLPSKIVDFEKTQARIDGKKVKAAADEDAKRAAALAKVEEDERKKASRIGVADLVGDAMGARELAINDKELNEQESVHNGSSRNRYNYGNYDDYFNSSSAEAKGREKKYFVSRYQTLKRMKQQLSAEVTRQRALLDEATRVRKRSKRHGEDDLETNSDDAATSGNQRLRQLEAQLSRIKASMKELERQAGNAGIYDIR